LFTHQKSRGPDDLPPATSGKKALGSFEEFFASLNLRIVAIFDLYPA
jgi:hypothetical protein